MTLNDGTNLETEDSEGNIQAMLAASTTPLLRVVWDIRGLRSATKGARASGTAPGLAEKMKCMALVVGNPVTRVVGTFFMRINRPAYPTRLFTSVSDAENWARTFEP